MNKIKLGSKLIGDGEKLYFIADIAANHDGDINRAFKLIELAKDAGADAAKFQNFQAEKIVSKRGFETMQGQLSHQKTWKKPVFETYKDASLPFDWAPRLKAKCDEVGVEYFTSPYDFESVDKVDPFVNFYKIGSGDITWPDIIEYIARKKKPVLIAAGTSTMEDVKRAMAILTKAKVDTVLMQCNTNYTANVENFKYINLNVLKTFSRLYPKVVLGLSDHTHGHAMVLGALALGARVFEKHFTDDNSREGPDHKFAMNPVTFRDMVDRAKELDVALGDGIKRIEANEADTAVVQRRCLRFTHDMKKGTVIKKEDLFPLRPIPVEGLPPFELGRLIGKKLNKDRNADDFIRQEDVV